MIKSFEELTEEKINFGKYHYIVIFILGLVFISEGMEMSAISLIFPILKVEWQISENIQAIIGSSLFIGFFFGSLIAGMIADKIGRKKSIEIICLFQFFLGVFSTTITNPYVFLILRGLFGFILGYIVPIVPTLCAELIPIDKRGKVTVFINALFSIGQLFASVIGWICLDNLSSGNWRVMLFICSLLPLVVWYYSYKYLQESPCFLIMKGEVEEGVRILNIIGKINQKDFKPFIDHTEFLKWKDYITIHKNNSSSGIISNFKYLISNYQRITMAMWTSWFGLNFVFYGLVFILPFFLNELDKLKNSNEGLSGLIYTTIGEGLSGVFAYFIVDSYLFGRKYSLALSQAISILCCLLTCFIDPIKHSTVLILLLSVARLFAKMCFSLIYPLTAEIYPTQLRTMGCGMASAVGRIAGCVMPIVAVKLFYINIYSPFLCFFIFGKLGLIGTFLIPYDTRGKYLDIEIDLNKNYKLQDLKEDLIINKYNK